MLLLKQQTLLNKLPTTLHSVQIPPPLPIQSLLDMNLRQHLHDRHQHIMTQYKSEMMKIYTETLEVKLRESQKLFDDEMTKLWQDQRSLPTHQRLKQTMIDLIDRHLTLITSQVECIYNYKKLQLIQ